MGSGNGIKCPRIPRATVVSVPIRRYRRGRIERTPSYRGVAGMVEPTEEVDPGC